MQTRADLASRLNEVLKKFDSVETLINGLKEICIKESWYWGDKRISNKLNNIFIENKGILPYLLMRYENALRDKETKTRGYNFAIENIKNPQIEHIAPQTKIIEESGKRKASEYCEYDKEFLENYLNCIGNLLLIAGSHNASIGNEPFNKKLESYEISPLKQLREIKNFKTKDIWDKEAIKKRHKILENFVLETWNFK